MNTIGYNTQTGIQLAQQGRKAEALAYLRYAVNNEPTNAEVWLWLAHVSPDATEYRHCVHQALILDPAHTTGLRMQQDLDFQARGTPPPVFAPHASHAMDKVHVGRQRLRRILLLLCAILIVSACGVTFDRLSKNVDTSSLNTMFPLLSETKTIQFNFGSETEAYSFTADVPTTWYLADIGSPSWQEERTRLQTDFPNAAGQPNLWQTLQADLGETRLNPATGQLSARLTLVETLSERIEGYYPTVPMAQLLAIQTLPVNQDNSCETLQLIAGETQTQQRQAEGYINTEVKQREDGSCVYFSEFNQTTDNDVIIRSFQLFIPVAQNRLAQWEIIIPEAEYADIYQKAVETLIRTLTWIENSPARPTSISTP